jgi:hypothetical protein
VRRWLRLSYAAPSGPERVQQARVQSPLSQGARHHFAAVANSARRPGDLAPNLLFHPVLNEAEALAGVSYRKVVYPLTQHRVKLEASPPLMGID